MQCNPVDCTYADRGVNYGAVRGFGPTFFNLERPALNLNRRYPAMHRRYKMPQVKDQAL